MRETSRETVKRLEKDVDGLYRYRDEYHQTGEDAEKKWKDVAKEAARILETYADCRRIDPQDRGTYFYLIGRVHNAATRGHAQEAEDALARAVKLDAKSWRAWNELGETYCRKSDLKEARTCFLRAADIQPNAESLRNLSILSRTPDFWDVAAGLRYAKEAVELDPKDGKSWLILGNAYTSFYSIKQEGKILDMCLSAYVIAERDERLGTDPHLHYNRGIVQKFRDDYPAALDSFDKAERLDPLWDEPKRETAKIIDYLRKAQGLIDEKGRVRGKKLRRMIRAINPSQHVGRPSRKVVQIADLKAGNRGKVALGVVAATFPDDARYNMILVDAAETPAVVNVYNLPDGKALLVGSVLAVPDPVVKQVRVTDKAGQTYSFPSIRVDNPSGLIVNGKPQTASKRNVSFSTRTLAD